MEAYIAVVVADIVAAGAVLAEGFAAKTAEVNIVGVVVDNKVAEAHIDLAMVGKDIDPLGPSPGFWLSSYWQ